MGLRVATLVNLSFLGMDKLEQRLARLLAPAATARCIPEGGQAVHHLGPAPDPLLHPPRQGLGSRLERGRGDSEPRAAAACCPRSSRCRSPRSCSCWPASIVAGTAILRDHPPAEERSAGDRPVRDLSLGDPAYEVALREDGEIVSRRPDARLRPQPAIVRPARPGGPGALPGGPAGRLRTSLARLAGGRQLPGRARRRVAVRAGRPIA